MSTITFQGQPVHLSGKLPATGNKAPSFTLIKKDLTEITLNDLIGKNILLNIFPSLDTGVCATSVRRFNKEAAALSNVEILAVSADLPFAAGRFCSIEGIDKITSASVFRNPKFAQNYGILMTDGPLEGLLARAIVIINTEGTVVYTELVNEITTEPNYKAAIDALLKIS
jgi:thiol peroxidase